MEGESLESVYPVRLPRVPLHQRRRRRSGHAPSHDHRGRAVAYVVLTTCGTTIPYPGRDRTPVTQDAPLRSECLLDPDARQRGVDANAKSAGNAQWLQLPADTSHHRRSYIAMRPPRLRTIDRLKAVRTRRHQWLGHILRMPSDRLLRRAVLGLGQQTGPPYQPGSLLMDTPLPLPELIMRAADRRGWARDSRSLSCLQD